MNGSLTDVPGIKVGHATDQDALTGCTVVLCEDGAICGVDQRGGAPGTRETDLLRPMHLVQKVHAVLLAGGSAFGLAAADGVMRYLVERRVGFDVGVARVPIVPAAIVFDLLVGQADVWPDAAMGYAACLAASTDPVAEGNVGAGTGCSVGKVLGIANATKAGIGSASADLGNGLIVSALVAVNALGDVIDPAGRIIAGARILEPSAEGAQSEDRQAPGSPVFADSLALLRRRTAGPPTPARGATIIGVVATSALLTKEEANLVAQMSHDGLARAIRPAHTLFDGDTLFALSLGSVAADITVVGAFAAEVMREAIVRAVRSVTGAGGLPCSRDLGL